MCPMAKGRAPEECDFAGHVEEVQAASWNLGEHVTSNEEIYNLNVEDVGSNGLEEEGQVRVLIDVGAS